MEDPDVCVFCAAPGCLNDTAQHATDCPFTTGMWPVEPEDIKRGAICSACEEPFAPGDLTAQITPPRGSRLADEVRSVVGGDMGIYDAEVTFTFCLPCAAMGAEVAG